MLKWHRFEGRAELDTQLSQVIIAALSDAIEQRDTAYLVVSGGSTPVGLFGELARNSELDWRKVVITLADERWVPRSHADSNQQLVEQQLLRAHAAAARFIPLYTGAATPSRARLVSSMILRLCRNLMWCCWVWVATHTPPHSSQTLRL